MKISNETLSQIIGMVYYGSEVEMLTVEDMIEHLETKDGYIEVTE